MVLTYHVARATFHGIYASCGESRLSWYLHIMWREPPYMVLTRHVARAAFHGTYASCGESRLSGYLRVMWGNDLTPVVPIYFVSVVLLRVVRSRHHYA